MRVTSLKKPRDSEVEEKIKIKKRAKTVTDETRQDAAERPDRAT